MSIVRVRPDVAATVWDANNETFVALTPNLPFDDKDPLVKEFAWAFQADTDTESKQRRTSVETASANPGEKRNR